jgi:cellulose synthase/poly-beta-1,6-N-acetylglucosamine synthase-like glycosyltransferase
MTDPCYLVTMITFASQVLLVAVAILAVPSAVFFVEVAAAIMLPKRSLTATIGDRRGGIAALIPAHNEAKGLLQTLTDIQGQLLPGDRLVVIADNCTDDTASIAATAGAEVTIRDDPAKIGKGYALGWGMTFLASAPPDIVIVIDADCRIAPGSIDRLATLSARTQRPAQSLYLMDAPDQSAINHQVAEFAWRVKNWVRPLGLNALGLPCQLMGTGMAFPWGLLRSVDLSSAALVEDLKLGLDLASVGHAPIFCPSAVVSSTFPTSLEGSKAQRQRWEHGHLGLILTRSLPLLALSLKQRSLPLLSLVLDLLVPPLSLLIMILMCVTTATALLAFFGFSSVSFLISLTCLGAVVFATILAWFKHARDILPPKALGLIPVYVLTKLHLYVSALLGRKVSQWVRADRS